MTKRLAFCGAILIALWGCATTQPTQAGSGRIAEDYYPLAVGNRWTYAGNFLGEKRDEVVEIAKEENGFFIDTQGAQLRHDAFGLRDNLRYLLREPIEVDQTWKNTVSVQSTEHYKILSVGATCDTPAGTFTDCVTVASSLRVQGDAELINEMTFARGVGLVRLEIDLKRGGVRTPQHRLLLKSFALAKPAAGAAP